MHYIDNVIAHHPPHCTSTRICLRELHSLLVHDRQPKISQLDAAIPVEEYIFLKASQTKLMPLVTI